ncbi:DsbA family protein [Kytococcus sp. Marseille-QA3725]
MPVDNSPRPSGTHRPKNSSGGGGVSKALIALIAALLVAALVVLGVWLFGKDDEKKGGGEESSAASSEEGGSGGKVKAPKGMSADETGVVVGESGGPEVAIFEDFQCPGCKSMEELLGDEINKRVDSGDIQVTYHVKTFLDGNIPGENSVRAASAAFCAQDAGKFREYHDTVFDNQPEEGEGYTDDDLKKFGKDAGIKGGDLKTFEKCVDEGTYKELAQKSEAETSEMGVTSTPTVYINGEHHELSNKEDFVKALDEAGAPEKSGSDSSGK